MLLTRPHLIGWDSYMDFIEFYSVNFYVNISIDIKWLKETLVLVSSN